MGQASIHLILFVLALSKLSDSERAELARSIKNGDHQAFKTFYEHHHSSLYRYLMSKGIAEGTARDLVQKAFIYIWEQREQIDPSKSLQAYLFRIGYTRMLNHIRDNKKFDESEELPVLEHKNNPEDDLRAAELSQAIDRAIAEMPEKRGLVFEMCFIQEFTYQETAESLGVSKKTVENHMGLALKDIRAALQQFDPKN